MKFATSACLLACLSLTTPALADAFPDAEAAALESQVDDAHNAHLEVRQGAIAVNPAPTANPLQYPTVNTAWFESTILSTTTWVQVVYTQTFAPVPDQGPSPGVGSIGYGTLKKNGKRDEPAETGIAGRVRI